MKANNNQKKNWKTPFSLTAMAKMALPIAFAMIALSPDANADAIFKVDKVAVEAVAQDAVSAKKEAIADGERKAFKLLLRRLVPANMYANLAAVDMTDVGSKLDGLTVHDEKNSRTKYIAKINFSFSPDAVRDVMRTHNLPYLDEQAPPMVVVPLSLNGQAAADQAQSPWRKAWETLDLIHAVTPMALGPVDPSITPAVMQALAANNAQTFANAKEMYGTPVLLFAIASTSSDGSKLTVTISGADNVGPLTLKRTYPVVGDVDTAMQKAASIAVSTFEGRWKQAKGVGAAGMVSAAPLQRLLVTVEFGGFREWQQIRKRLGKVPGVAALEVSSLSARGAEVMIDYPGGAEGLAPQLAAQQMALENVGGALMLRAY